MVMYILPYNVSKLQDHKQILCVPCAISPQSLSPLAPLVLYYKVNIDLSNIYRYSFIGIFSNKNLLSLLCHEVKHPKFDFILVLGCWGGGRGVMNWGRGGQGVGEVKKEMRVSWKKWSTIIV